jgi:hypothetical protein
VLVCQIEAMEFLPPGSRRSSPGSVRSSTGSASATASCAGSAEARCTQLVNPKYTYIVKIGKRYLG